MVPAKRWRIAPRVIVWDVDDTLILERDFARSGFAAVSRWLEQRGTSGFFEAAWNAFERGVRGTTFNLALRELGMAFPDEAQETAFVRTLVGVYRGHAPDIAMLPDASAAIDGAMDAAIAMAAITDGPPGMQRQKVDAIRLAEVAHPIVFGWADGREFGKPHAQAYKKVQAATGAQGDALVYVADNPKKDFVAPRALGWRTVRVRREHGIYADGPSGDDVDVELSDLTTLLDVLGIAG